MSEKGTPVIKTIFPNEYTPVTDHASYYFNQKPFYVIPRPGFKQFGYTTYYTPITEAEIKLQLFPAVLKCSRYGNTISVIGPPEYKRVLPTVLGETVIRGPFGPERVLSKVEYHQFVDRYNYHDDK